MPISSFPLLRHCALVLSVIVLVGCSHVAKKRHGMAKPRSGHAISHIVVNPERREIVLYALGLLEANYQFGGAHPEAGVDCSGMVVFIYKNALGIPLPRSARDIARVATPLPRHRLLPGDLVFFNTLNRPYSHIGIYLGDNKFIHATSRDGRVKLASLDTPYFATRFDGGGTVLK